MVASNVLQRFAAKKRGAFEALTCPPVTNLATKNEPGVYHCPPHVFLGAVGISFYSLKNSLITVVKSISELPLFDAE